ncbi:MAG: four helix bundle protein [Myxococcales bacterium]|nr:four helix bundle protein [Myxococcales bacterium]
MDVDVLVVVHGGRVSGLAGFRLRASGFRASGLGPRASGARAGLDLSEQPRSRVYDKRFVSRNPRNLVVFRLADELVLDVYKATRLFSLDERFGLRAQLRRAAVSVPTNLVEGCARPTARDYRYFVAMALSSASEVRYLLGLSTRLGELDAPVSATLVARYDKLVRSLQSLVGAIGREIARAAAARGPRPEA